MMDVVLHNGHLYMLFGSYCSFMLAVCLQFGHLNVNSYIGCFIKVLLLKFCIEKASRPGFIPERSRNVNNKKTSVKRFENHSFSRRSVFIVYFALSIVIVYFYYGYFGFASIYYVFKKVAAPADTRAATKTT